MPLQDFNFLLYADTGASSDCIEEWTMFFKSNGIEHKLCNADDIKNGILKSVKCLIISGGADLPYCEKLNGAGNANIIEFVNNGGVYFGICAGAYYAHSDINWQNTTETITEARELAFFKGTASGPLVKPYNPQSNAGIVFVELQYGEQLTTVYYKGGPVMIRDDETEVVATFRYNNIVYPAIIRKSVGAGVAIAMSPHMEYSNNFLVNKNLLLSDDVAYCENRAGIFMKVMQDLFI